MKIYCLNILRRPFNIGVWTGQAGHDDQSSFLSFPHIRFGKLKVLLLILKIEECVEIRITGGNINSSFNTLQKTKIQTIKLNRHDQTK